MSKKIVYFLPGLILFGFLSLGVIAVSANNNEEENKVNSQFGDCRFQSFNESQRENFLAKKQEIDSFKEELKNLSSEERQAKMEEFKEKIEEWKKENGIDSDFGPMKNFRKGRANFSGEKRFKNFSPPVTE